MISKGSLRVGITGFTGFVGTHLLATLRLQPNRYEPVLLPDGDFSHESALRAFVRECDVIVHLAALNRHPEQEVIYATNVRLVEQLIEAMRAEQVTPHLLFSSSTQEKLDNAYGRSKLHGRKLLEEWATQCGASFTGLVVPNVYGEFSKPNYNTFIATFAHKLIHGQTPTILNDANVPLIHVGSLCRFIMSQFPESGVRRVEVPWDCERKVSDVLALFTRFQELYTQQGIIPVLQDKNDINLFNTFRSYIPPRCMKLAVHGDERGVFVETAKVGTGGQFSFSTTVPGVTRGNHFHTRKIERFIVMKGRARIQLRRVGTEQVFEFELDGTEPAYVDMPVWYTHNITNIGQEELYTQFWINEWYDPEDGDTYFETV